MRSRSGPRAHGAHGEGSESRSGRRGDMPGIRSRMRTDAGRPESERGGQAAEAGLELVRAEGEMGRQPGREKGGQRYHPAAPGDAVDEAGRAPGEDEEGESEGRELVVHRSIVAMDLRLRNMVASSSSFARWKR